MTTQNSNFDFYSSKGNKSIWLPSLMPSVTREVNANQEPWDVDNGINIIRDGNNIKITTDNFGTTPVYFDEINKIFKNDVNELDTKIDTVENIDQVAFWEGVIFDYSFLGRTLNNGVVQIEGGSHFNYNVELANWNTKRWNYFNSREFIDITPDEAINLIDSRLQTLCKEYWKILPSNGRILLPLSGGLDSRLLALHLATTGDPNRIEAVTFGYSMSSFEYRIANQVAKALGIKNHKFHQLDHHHFLDRADEFWSLSQGNLSVLHSHLFSFLKANKPENTLLVTGFYCDPIAGYAAQEISEDFNSIELKDSKVYARLNLECERLDVKDSIRDQILGDLTKLFVDWKENKPLHGFDEYIYQSQRQAKTFSPLLQIYRTFCPVATPFADPMLVKMFIGLPYALRKEKNIIRRLISYRNRELSKIFDISSSISTSNIASQVRAYLRLWITRASMSLNIFSNDRIRLISPYLTEDLFGSMRKESFDEINKVCEKLLSLGIISKTQHAKLNKKALNSKDAAIQARFITFAPFLRKFY